jgi:hypothetical protein
LPSNASCLPNSQALKGGDIGITGEIVRILVDGQVVPSVPI